MHPKENKQIMCIHISVKQWNAVDLLDFQREIAETMGTKENSGHHLAGEGENEERIN